MLPSVRDADIQSYRQWQRPAPISKGGSPCVPATGRHPVDDVRTDANRSTASPADSCVSSPLRTCPPNVRGVCSLKHQIAGVSTFIDSLHAPHSIATIITGVNYHSNTRFSILIQFIVMIIIIRFFFKDYIQC